MGDAARAEPRAGDALLDCLVTALAAFQGRRDAHAFIDLMAQLATERSRGVTLPEAFAAAAASTSKSQLAQACRRVPRPR
jgi:type II secretory pathway component PulF